METPFALGYFACSIHTLAKKFETVHSNTVARMNIIPSACFHRLRFKSLFSTQGLITAAGEGISELRLSRSDSIDLDLSILTDCSKLALLLRLAMETSCEMMDSCFTVYGFWDQEAKGWNVNLSPSSSSSSPSNDEQNYLGCHYIIIWTMGSLYLMWSDMALNILKHRTKEHIWNIMCARPHTYSFYTDSNLACFSLWLEIPCT